MNKETGGIFSFRTVIDFLFSQKHDYLSTSHVPKEWVLPRIDFARSFH